MVPRSSETTRIRDYDRSLQPERVCQADDGGDRHDREQDRDHDRLNGVGVVGVVQLGVDGHVGSHRAACGDEERHENEWRNRAGEAPRNYIRTDRVFAIDDAWYFMTREKCRMGPFATREDALMEIQSMFAPNKPAVTA